MANNAKSFLAASMGARIGKGLVFVLLSVLVLTACSNDVPSSDRRVERSISTVEEDAIPIDQPAEPDIPPESRHYTRDEQYPAVYKQALQYIDTKSGQKLGVFVTLPAWDENTPAEGPFPTILIQTAYNINLVGSVPFAGSSVLSAADPYLVKRGYAYVNVDVVGTGVSTGGWEMIGEQEQAGYGDAVDWIVAQPWSNGKIGVSGASYMAITALLTAAQRPEQVKAAFALVPMGDALRGTAGIGGLVNGLFMSYWLKLTQELTVQNSLAQFFNPDLKTQIAAATQEHIDQIDNYYLPIIDKAINGDPQIAFDNPFWRTRSPLEQIDKIQAPTFIFGALHDIFQRDAPLLYEALAKRGVESRLAIYDGDHITNFIQAAIGSNTLDSFPALLLQWFDAYLMGLDSGVDKIPQVTQYVKNKSYSLGKSMVTSTAWPHPEAAPERWYLRGDMRLTKKAPGIAEDTNSMLVGAFADYSYGKTTDGKGLEFEIMPADGSDCSISQRQWTLGMAGIMDNKECYADHAELERDALNYQTDTMDEDYYINGPIQADIWIDSTVTDAVLSVRLEDVNPATGAVTPISNGSLLASARAVDESRSRFIDGVMIQPYHFLTEDKVLPVVPGDVFKMSVEIFPTSIILKRGHKLRASISPSNQAQGILNELQRERINGGATTIYNSPDFPSSIVLPIVPLSALE